MRKFNYIAYVMLSILLFSACASPSESVLSNDESLGIITVAAQEATLPAKGDEVLLSVMGRDISIDANSSGAYFDIDMMTSEFPVDITLKESAGYQVTIDGIEINGQTFQYQFKKLEHDYNIPIVFKDLESGKEITNYFRSLPNAIEKFYTIGDGETGKYYFTLAGWLVKMDHDGAIVFYKKTNGCSDFKRYKFGEKTRYTYLENCDSPIYNRIREGEGPTSRAIIMDEKYKVIEEVPYLLSTDSEYFDRYPLDDHEFVMLEDGHYIIISYLCKRVNNIPDSIEHSVLGGRASAAIIQEIRDGQLIFHWDSAQYPELYTYSVEGNDFDNDGEPWSADYAHINSVEVDPTDNNLIVSFRNMDAVVKLNRTTGDIIWVLGGPGDQFGLTANQKFSRQHFARVTELGTRTLFDNGNINKQTRFLEFKLDEENKKLMEFNEFMMEGQFAPYCGSVQRVSTTSDRFVTGWGVRATAAPLISEIDFTQNKVMFEVLAFTQPMAGQVVYRAYKFDN